jgi:2-polyprenyl-3-methyl-5-hydroxy-6-metoxy-1,4-benzoquinol methylase
MKQAGKVLDYKFYPVTHCNMCGSDPSFHKLMGHRLNQSQGFSPKNKLGISVSIQKCRKCGLVFSNPMPVPEDFQAHYGIPPEEYWNSEDFAWKENYFAPELQVLNQLMPVQKGMRALDIGAGLGKCMISLEKAGFEAYGMEPSEPFYERAVSKMNISKERLQLGMLEDVDYPKDHFDFITFGAVLEHLYDPAESIRKAVNWLKPKGLIHIEVPCSRFLFQKLVNVYNRILGTQFVTNVSPMHPPFHLYEFDIRSFRELGLKTDFEIVKHQYFVCDVMFVPRLIKPLFSAYMKWTDTGMQLVVWLKKK